ncbi:MAG: sulfur reduction protein DsrJ [Granulosicoccus sp.]|nr:sulfur reduction protein DsrJ [Granulosicoccus sp.]
MIQKSTRALLIVFAMAFSPILLGDMPELPRGKGDFCVEPTDVMRKNHMAFLLHQRDETVINGIRTKKHSLVGCIDCHVQSNSDGDFIPVDAPDQFCEVCHTFASVKLDCFECHATTPDEPHSAMNDLNQKDTFRSKTLEQEIRQFLAHSRIGISSGAN